MTNVNHLFETSETVENQYIDASIADVLSELRIMHKLKKDGDIIAPTKSIRMDKNGLIHITPKNSDAGTITIKPNGDMLSQMAQRMFGQVKYLRHMQETGAHELIIKHFNDWFEFESEKDKSRDFLIRTIQNPGTSHTGRALLSDRYKAIDNLPIFTAVIDAVKKVHAETGVKVVPVTQSLTISGMTLRFVCPEIEHPTALLNRYRNPQTGEKSRGITSGFVVWNSEIGKKSAGIAARLFIGACKNGMIWADEKSVWTHLGQTLDHGVVDWSAETIAQNLRLIESQIRDAVKKFTGREFIGKTMAQIEELADKKLESPILATTNICKELRFTEKETDDTLNWLMNQGTARNAFDVMQAITFEAHNLNPDRRFDAESKVFGLVSQIERFDRKPEPEMTPDERASLN